MEPDEAVGQRVAELRKQRNLRQEDFLSLLEARGIAWTQTILSRVEKGTRPMRFVEAVGVASALGVEVVELTPFGGGFAYLYRRRLDLLDERQWAVYRAKNDLHSAEVSVQLLRLALELSQGSRTQYLLRIRPHHFVSYISHQIAAGSVERVLALLGIDEALISSRFDVIDQVVDAEIGGKDDDIAEEDFDALLDEVERKVRNRIVDEIFSESFPNVTCDPTDDAANEFAIDFPTPVVDGIDTSDFERQQRYPTVTNLRHGR